MGMKPRRNLSAEAKGGLERARRLSPEDRSTIAQTAALTRWAAEGKAPPAIAKYGGPDRPLRIMGIEIPCYVLADGRRVLAQRGLQGGIGLSEGGGTGGEQRMTNLLRGLEAKGIDIRDLIARIEVPIRFIPPHGGNAAHGYEADILPDLCAVMIEAGRLGKLQQQQLKLAERCAVLQHGFATVGINAMVDEATGYQDVRARDALAIILEKFVAKELRPWMKTFPTDFYREIYRLNGWTFDADNSARPGIVGHWTNNVVYKRLAPFVLAELQRQTPRLESGRLKYKMFQRLTDEVGSPKLMAHLAGVVMLMKYSPDWKTFMQRLDKEYPQYGSSLMLPFPEGYAPPANALAAAPATGGDPLASTSSEER